MKDIYIYISKTNRYIFRHKFEVLFLPSASKRINSSDI